MRQMLLPFYRETFPAPERSVLTLLHAALQVTEQCLREEHPMLERISDIDEHHAPVVVAAARLITGRCVELRQLLDLYDNAVDHVLRVNDEIPF